MIWKLNTVSQLNTALKHLLQMEAKLPTIILPSINAIPDQKNRTLYLRIITKHSVQLFDLHHPDNNILQFYLSKKLTIYHNFCQRFSFTCQKKSISTQNPPQSYVCTPLEHQDCCVAQFQLLHQSLWVCVKGLSTCNISWIAETLEVEWNYLTNSSLTKDTCTLYNEMLRFCFTQTNAYYKSDFHFTEKGSF